MPWKKLTVLRAEVLASGWKPKLTTKKGCVGKIRFPSIAAAERHLRQLIETGEGQLRRHYRHKRHRLGIYSCQACGDHHIGHSDRR